MLVFCVCRWVLHLIVHFLLRYPWTRRPSAVALKTLPQAVISRTPRCLVDDLLAHFLIILLAQDQQCVTLKPSASNSAQL